MPAPRGDWRLLALLGVSATLGLLLALLLFELYTHWRFDLGHRFHDLNTRFDAQLGWAVIEGRNVETPMGRLSSNRHGFRSRELDPAAAQVIALGDSVAWGWGVADREALPWRLDERWSGRGLQVSNLAVAGYGLDQYLLSFDAHEQLFPDLRAVLAVITTADDLKSSSTNSAFGRRKPLFELREGRLVQRPEPIRHYGLRNLRSRSTVLTTLEASRLGPAIRAALDPFTGDLTLAREQGEAVGRALLEALAQRAAARGARFSAVLVPARMDFPAPGVDHRWFLAQCASLRLDCLDFRDALAARNDALALYLDDVHLNARGLELLAAAVAEHLEPVLGASTLPAAEARAALDAERASRTD